MKNGRGICNRRSRRGRMLWAIGPRWRWLTFSNPKKTGMTWHPIGWNYFMYGEVDQLNQAAISKAPVVALMIDGWV